ncbi:MAG: helix-turn-helix domain-containing protein [Bacillota bacterium]
MKIDGTKIKILRKRMNLTIQQLADQVGLSSSAIGMYERGKRNPDLKTIHIFARFFSVEIDYFLDGMTVNQEKIDISYTVNQALERASGICELCGGMAPFIRSNGIPYLETYKIKGSSHVAAVCPNCRKKLEILELPGDIIYLQQKINNTHT